MGVEQRIMVVGEGGWVDVQGKGCGFVEDGEIGRLEGIGHESFQFVWRRLRLA